MNRYTFLIFLVGLIFGAKAQIQIGESINDFNGASFFGQSVSMGDSKTVAVGAPGNQSGGNERGYVKVYSWNGSFWSQKGGDIIGEFVGDHSGSSVFMSDENTLAIAATFNNASRGQVRVYKWNGVNWVQKGGDIIGEANGDNFGASICMSDSNTIAVSAPDNIGNGLNTGHVRIYSWNGLSWIQKGVDINGDSRWDGAVSMPNSNILAIGESEFNGGGYSRGQVKIYDWIGYTWLQRGSTIFGEADFDYSGGSVNMPDGNTIAIGASHNDGSGIDAGHVRIYKWDGSSWVQKGLDIDGEYDYDYSCFSVMPDANTIAIAAHFNDGASVDAGQVRIYVWDGNNWVQKGLDIDGETPSLTLGYSISMSDNNTLAIGVLGDGSGAQLRVYKFSGVVGRLFNDFNEDCVYNQEVGISNGLVNINPGNIILETNSQGIWYIDSLSFGNYSITYNVPNNWRSNCQVTQSFSVTDSLTHAPDFGLVSTQPCAIPEISIIAPFLRRCFSNQIILVKACNQNLATDLLNSAYVDVELDSLLTPTSSSLPYINLGNNKFRFELDTLNPGQCVNFSINTTVSCAANLQQTLCMEARLFPADSCVFDTIATPTLPVGPGTVTPCNLPWDKSSLSVDGYCANDTVYFTITNTGSASNGNMLCYAPVRVYVDGVLSYTDSIMLGGGQTITYSYAGNGQTWILQADQHPLHPGNSHPNAHVEACGNLSNWTPNLVNDLPLDDADPIVDIYCGVVSGAYDPNDKTGFPTGLGTEHEILPNQQLQYLIRFQNTGTDTAFNIVVRDTLDADLNIFSVVPGVASHNYSFRMYGPRVLEWTFNNIMLPDSNVNEATSHGFLTFTVDQQPNLTNGTAILNDADIYFDFNVPVITNETVHTINNQLHNFAVGIAPLGEKQKSTIKVYPNPTKGSVHVGLNELSPKTEITVLNVLGQQMSKQYFYNVNSCSLTIEGEPGVYFIKVVSGGKTEYVKLLKL